MTTEGIPSKSQVESRKIAVAVLLAVGVLSFCFGYSLITSLQLDHNFENFLSQDDPRTSTFFEHRDRFGTENDFILIGIVNNQGVFNSTMRAKVDSLCKTISQLQYVDSVISPYDYADFAVNMKRKLYPPLLADPGLLIPDSIRILSDSRYADTFFSTSQPAVSIFVKTEDLLSKKKCDYLADTIPKTTALFAFDEVHHSGRSIGQSGYLKLMESDMIFFMQLSVILLVLFLWVTYRSFWGITVPILVVVLANIWTLGIMALIGEPVNLILTILPSIIFVVGMSDVVHITAKYVEELRNGLAKIIAVRIALKEIGLATLLTSTTTAIGFLTLLTSTSQPIRIFGVYTAVGVMIAFLLAITILPAVLILTKQPSISRNDQSIWTGLLRNCLLVVIRHPIKIVALFTLIFVVSLYFLSGIKQDNYLLEDLRSGNQIKRDFVFFEDHFAGVRPFEMMINVTDTSKNILEYDILLEIQKLEEYLINVYGVKGLISPLTLIRSLNELKPGGQFKLPSFQDYQTIQPMLTKQVTQSNNNNFATHLTDLRSRYIDSSGQLCRMGGRVGDLGSNKFSALNTALDQFYKNNIDQSLIKYQVTGTAHLIDINNARLGRSMMLGLLIAFILVATIMGILFKSFKMLIIALVPNALPLVFIAAVLGATGEDLKVSISIIFTIAFGIAVDDTIHFMSKIKLELMKGKSMWYALKRTYISTGRALIITTLILCSGFFLFIFSEFFGTFYIGYLVSITLFVALIADLFLLPALLVISEMMKRKNLYGKS